MTQGLGELAVSTRHGHLWQLADGTGLHAPPGFLTIEQESGLLCCHLCGRWFRSLGAHVRVHGHTASSYRDDMGLPRGQALIEGPLSAAIASRQQQLYGASPDLQSSFAAGRQTVAKTQRSRLSAAAIDQQARARGAGLATRQARRSALLAEVIESAGFSDLGEMLRARYAAGASLEALARETGLGRDALRRALDDAGIRLRAPGQNTDAGRRSRARAADLAAGQRLGTDDLLGWLQARRDEGWTLQQIGKSVGHSYHWVSARLNERLAQLSRPG